MCSNAWGRVKGKKGGQGGKRGGVDGGGKGWRQRNVVARRWENKWKGGEKRLGRVRLKPFRRWRGSGWHHTYEELVHYRAVCGYRGRADICVGQLAPGNEISAQIMFHTSLDSPATLSHLNACRRYVRFQSLNNPLHLFPPPLLTVWEHAKWKHTHINIALLSVVINLSWARPVGGGGKVRRRVESHSGFANKRTKEDGCSLAN